jgi:hypothetical protein
MPFYATAEQLYGCAQFLFQRILAEDPRAADAVLASRLLIAIRCYDPLADIIINGRRRPLETTFGSSPGRPDLEVQLAGDTLHQILLGRLTVKKALASGLLKARGPVWKTSALAELFERGQALYPSVLRQHGFEP